jgi:predicted RNA-binding Zn ribbon-like protein
MLVFPAKLFTPETLHLEPPGATETQLDANSSARPHPPRPLPIVAGHLALDFANTVDDPEGPRRHDHAATYDAVVGWALRTGCVTDAPAARLRRAAAARRWTPPEPRSARELRHILNAIFGRVADGRSDLAQPWTRLRPFVADALVRSVLADSGTGFQRRTWPPGDELTVLLHPVAAAAADLLVSPRLSLVKRCARCRGCSWTAPGTTAAGGATWTTGGRAQKIERYVARRAAGRTAGDGR